ncbi:hypothetical protein DPMN_093377 [Dreissena polymorpha]|uniref:Uncharacterized protein n=1 Tax=Dreissena polymorpha TaxID=45954 RepID=A0A9D4L5L7_DREPO|nr:hypothetical protein DPMN_093377 [Dreissena polymorpha]
MMKLEEVNPDVYQQYLDGFHCIIRSDRYWAGVNRSNNRTSVKIVENLRRLNKRTGYDRRTKSVVGYVNASKRRNEQCNTAILED